MHIYLAGLDLCWRAIKLVADSVASLRLGTWL